jgi:hypothetical protein
MHVPHGQKTAKHITTRLLYQNQTAGEGNAKSYRLVPYSSILWYSVGLEQWPSIWNSKKSRRFWCIVDGDSPSLMPGRKGHDPRSDLRSDPLPPGNYYRVATGEPGSFEINSALRLFNYKAPMLGCFLVTTCVKHCLQIIKVRAKDSCPREGSLQDIGVEGDQTSWFAWVWGVFWDVDCQY